MGKQDEAIAAFSRGLKDEPNSTELMYQLAVHLPEDKLDVLKQHFGKVGKPNEQFSALAPRLENVYAFKALEALVNAYAAIAPDEPDVKYYRARVQASREEYSQAAAALKGLLASDADKASRIKHLALYELVMLEMGRATEAYNEARDTEAEQAFVNLAGEVSIRPDAKEQLASLIAAHEKRQPNSPSLDYYRGEMAGLNENWPEAIASSARDWPRRPTTTGKWPTGRTSYGRCTRQGKRGRARRVQQ